MRRVAISLVIACVIPATLFYACFRLYGVWTAIVVALGWSYGAIAWRALTGRRTSGLLLLTALLITARTLISLAAGSTFLYFLQPIISDALVGTAFLASLATARPMVARLAGDFYPMDDELHLRPRIQRLFRNLTVLWAGALPDQGRADPLAAAVDVARDLRAGQERLGAEHQHARRRRHDRPGGPGRPQGGPAARRSRACAAA